MNNIKISNDVEKCEFDTPDIHKIHSIVDNFIRDCHNKSLHTFEYRSIYDNKLTTIGNKEVVTLTFSDKSMNLNEINKKSKNARNCIRKIWED